MFFPPYTLELTFALFKPALVKSPVALQAVRDAVLAHKFYVVRYSRVCMSDELASKFYEEHKGKFFFKRLVVLMTSGPTDALILAREDAIKQWRELMGPTRTLESQYKAPMSLRGTYGISDTRNATHGSDSAESVLRESKLFFPDFDVCCWFSKQEKYFRNGYVRYNEKELRHVPAEEDAPKNLDP